jgi:hypothetical protein
VWADRNDFVSIAAGAGEPSKLRAWNEMVDDVNLPSDFAVAFMSGRPELLGIIKRPLSAEETAAVARAMATILMTNVELQRHSQVLADMVRDAYGNLKGLTSKLSQLEDYANFRQPIGDDDD